MKPLNTDLEEIIKNLGLYEKMRLYLIQRDFEKVFPPPLSEHIYPSSLSKDQLLIIVDSSEWLHEVGLRKEAIEARLGSYGISSVRFKLGRVYRKKRRVKKALKTPVRVPDELYDEVTSRINDPSIRESMLKAIRASMSTRDDD